MRDYYSLNNSTTDSHLDFVGNMTHITPNDITIMFFKDETVDMINKILINRIREETYNKYGKRLTIQPQNKNHVLTIMRYVYFKNIKNRGTAEEQVDILINLTVETMVPTVLHGLVTHIKFINDYNSDSVYRLNSLPEATKNKLDKQLTHNFV